MHRPLLKRSQCNTAFVENENWLSMEPDTRLHVRYKDTNSYHVHMARTGTQSTHKPSRCSLFDASRKGVSNCVAGCANYFADFVEDLGCSLFDEVARILDLVETLPHAFASTARSQNVRKGTDGSPTSHEFSVHLLRKNPTRSNVR